jgi:two-component system chemotaxis response regulator CheY
MSLAEKLRVMVVDDTSVSRALIVDALDQMGVRGVTIAKDGVAALNSLKTQPVHLVISDMNMPGGLDGLALLKSLREHKPTSRIGFILVTGSNDRSLIERGRQYALNNYVTKPFTVTSLRGAIEAVIGKLS